MTSRVMRNVNREMPGKFGIGHRSITGLAIKQYRVEYSANSAKVPVIPLHLLYSGTYPELAEKAYEKAEPTETHWVTLSVYDTTRYEYVIKKTKGFKK